MNKQEVIDRLNDVEDSCQVVVYNAAYKMATPILDIFRVVTSSGEIQLVIKTKD